jgi:predicted adenine nucleotide alpha hydrolase (AANH) superfamily ATPase
LTDNKKILLHTCCGICSSYPISYLQNEGYEVTAYFYNPNIYPEEEYQKRLEAEKTLCEHFNCKLIVGEYEPDVYYEYVKGLEEEPEKGKRCDKCFALRLEQSAKIAKQLNIPVFTTSMVISPHKDYEKLTKTGNEIAKKHGLEYLSTNFRKNDGFLKTNQISKELNLYRQNYCGCKFSIRN